MTSTVRFWYDTEFIERGPDHPIIPVSLGMIREDGERLYLINGQAPLELLYDNTWLRANVLKWLPVMIHPDTERPGGGGPLIEWNEDSYSYSDHVWSIPEWQTRLEEFLGEGRHPVELWADWSAYDHVLLAQVWGTMLKLPRWMPQRTHCTQQLIDDLGLREEWSELAGSLEAAYGPTEAHNALHDAGWTKEVWAWCHRMKSNP